MTDARRSPHFEAIPRDTTPEAMAKRFEVLPRMGGADRAGMTFELSDNLHSLVAAGVRRRRPDWKEQAVERETVRFY